MKTILSLVFTLSLLVIALPESQAQNQALRTTPRIMQGVRPEGMGGAFIAIDGTDENALFYNPAALNDYEEEFGKKFHMQFLLPSIEISAKAASFFLSDVRDLADDIDAAATTAAKVNAFDNFAIANTGRFEEIGLHGPIATFMHKWVTASIFYDNRSVVSLRNAANRTIRLDAATHGGLQVGSSYSFFDKKIQVGGAVKVAVRHLINETVTRADIIANDDFGDSLDLKRTGVGVGVDLGGQFKAPIKNVKVWDYLDPTFAFTWQDIGDTRFSGNDNVGRLEQSITLGFALHPKIWKFESNFAFDVRDIQQKADFTNKLRVGYELIWPEISKILREASIRVGGYQAYISAGLGLDFKYFKLNFATYGRELGETTRQKESRMLAVQLAAGF